MKESGESNSLLVKDIPEEEPKRKQKRQRTEEEEKGEKEEVEETERDQWRALTKGSLERGFVVAYQGMEHQDVPGYPNSFLWWGLFLVTNLPCNLRECVMLIQNHPNKFVMADNIDDTTVLLKWRDSLNFPMVLNRGLTPCVTSLAEMLIPPSKEKECFHFQYSVNRNKVYPVIDWLHTHLPGCAVYIPLTLHPSMQLLYCPPNPNQKKKKKKETN